jgi:5,10-methylenetetrahydrofolate reductase
VIRSLVDRIERRETGIVLYGLSPPKRDTGPEELQAIAGRQVTRLATLPVDGIIVYDLQDESERTGEARPFPFLPTVDPSSWARDYLSAATAPKIVYHCTHGDTAAGFVEWLQRLRAHTAPLAVLVGAPSTRTRGSLALDQAYALAREHAPEVRLGGIAIAERHARRLDEHERIRTKVGAGCRFVVTQAVYDVTATKSLLSDYALATRDRGEPPAPIILTFAPCGSAKTLAFMKWLGIAFPRWLENDLARAADPLTTSIEICAQIFTELWAYARAQGLPLGINVESVSIRKAEIDAAAELLHRLRRITLAH